MAMESIKRNPKRILLGSLVIVVVVLVVWFCGLFDTEPKVDDCDQTLPFYSGKFDPKSTDPNQGFGFESPISFLDHRKYQQFWKEFINSLDRGEIHSFSLKGRWLLYADNAWTDQQDVHYHSYDSNSPMEDCPKPGQWRKLSTSKSWPWGTNINYRGIERDCGSYKESLSIHFGSTFNRVLNSKSYEFQLSKLTVTTKKAEEAKRDQNVAK